MATCCGGHHRVAQSMPGRGAMRRPTDQGLLGQNGALQTLEMLEMTLASCACDRVWGSLYRSKSSKRCIRFMIYSLS